MKNKEGLSIDDLIVIKEALRYTKDKFENYTMYPSYEYKLQRIDEVAAVAHKVDTIIKQQNK